jgi:hypothetical protein
MVANEYFAAFGYWKMRQQRSAAGNEANGVSAGVGIDAEKAVPHGFCFPQFAPFS